MIELVQRLYCDECGMCGAFVTKNLAKQAAEALEGEKLHWYKSPNIKGRWIAECNVSDMWRITKLPLNTPIEPPV